MKLSKSHWLSVFCVVLSVTLPHFVAAAECDSDCQVRIEQGVQLYNQFEYDQAQAVFQAEADKGSAHARYWLGVTQYATGGTYEPGQNFLKAAKMGNPWAMDILVPDDYTGRCEMAGWPCDEKWAEKALKGWEKLAAEGDGKAMYAYFIRSKHWWDHVPFYRQSKRNEIYKEIINHGGYMLSTSGVEWKSNEDRVTYLLVAAEKGYVPAMHSLFYYQDYIGKENGYKWINKALELGYPDSAESLYFSYRNGTRGMVKDKSKEYFFNRLSSYMLPNFIYKADVKELIEDEKGNATYRIIVTSEEQAEMDKKVEDFLQRVKPNRYLDETTHELFRKFI